MNWWIPLSFVIVLSNIGLFLYSFHNHKTKDQNKDVKEIKKSTLMVIAHYFNIIVCTILTIPLFLPSILTFFCFP
jgi:hypothetical protein